ncbi:MAG: FAD binding domain-containing protein [Acidimicrobiia bacterium]|jgi:CO/xanthine dehydrogenase FAD-binding subunit
MPVTGIRSFERPDTLGEAWGLVQRGGGRVRLLGGGTDLTIHCPPEVDTLVDLSRCGLADIDLSADGRIRVGAMATLTDLLEHPAVVAHASGVMSEMLVDVGSPLLRNAATVGGHLARGFLSDVVPVLLALDATVSYHDGADHEVELAAYYGDGLNHRPHILTRLDLPPRPEPAAAAFLRFSRTGFDHALANTACRVDLADGHVADVRVAVGVAPGVARRVAPAEVALVGGILGPEEVAAAADLVAGDLEQMGDGGPSGPYRRHLAGVLVGRCLSTVRDRLEGRE